MIRKVPFIEQFHQTECGLCCVAMILRYYRSFNTLNDLRDIAEVGRDGLNLKQVHDLFKALHFHSKVYRTEVKGLEAIDLPSVLFWNSDHFVVLEKVRKNKFTIVDPAIGRRTLPLKEFEKSFSNIVLVPQPKHDFKAKKQKESSYKFLSNTVVDNKKTFILLFVLSFFTAMGTLLMPIIIQNLTDSVIKKGSISIFEITISLLLLVLFFLLQYFQGVVLIQIKSTLDQTLISKVFSHLLKVPYKFFESRPTGDIQYRLSSVEFIKDLLSEKAIKGILDVVSLIVILFYIAYKSLSLFMLVTILFSVFGVVTILIRPKLKELNLYEVLERSKIQRLQIETITAIFNIKLSGIENEVFHNWKKQLKNVIRRYKKKGALLNFYNTFSQGMQTIAPFVVLLVGFYLYIQQELTFGEVLAFYSVTSMFFTTSTSMFQLINDLLVATTNIDRIKDITDAKIENDHAESKNVPVKGDIVLKNVCFTYAKSSEAVLNDINIRIEKGQKIAIVGRSGSGKSTLGKLLLGLYEPTSGDIFYDGINLKNINKKELRRNMGAVPQDIYLFNKSIYENIAMGKPDVSYEDMMRALKIVNIDEEINEMPMKHKTLISNMGMNLSGGQRQRLALARAIINEPGIVLLDEATSSLDSVNEAKIASHFIKMGSTCMIIAHRLSTIVDSDIIFVMKNGSIVEQGKHKELLQKNGEYYRLYASSIDGSKKDLQRENVPL
ncbi:peptidase domain-containing ABC transporter [Bacillus changyiensis]|uniref:peptidase domain-containing ABC transporter n=1 Tax=Bacillus changyiensis TaxID=3004103 RepID=UPI0022DEE139|nr:peptidase domain-containing ABC transporter [Bacillus changyiensis]MDA1477686.1 peptidase domain-containing ABC transporter [Bacillus changyiensis]